MTDWIRGSGAVIAGVALGAILVRAAVAKIRSRAETEAEFASLGLAVPAALAVAVPVVELIVAALLVATPAWGGILAAALLAAFTAVLVRVLRDPGGLRPSCACFGGADRSPVSVRHLARNGVLFVLAFMAASYDGQVGPLFASVLY